MDIKIKTITLWDEKKEGGAFMVVRDKANKKEVNERCEECGHSIMVHFDVCGAHKKECPKCGDIVNLSKDVLWKYKCSCGKVIKPAKNENINSSILPNNKTSSHCPD